jgi:flagellin
MSQVINTNVLSLNAQRNLARTQGDLATSLQRLSSGLRINSAKDDAAGLAISERFTTQIRGLNQAVRNANDGISLAQTAEGALSELTSNLQRIRELAVQAANSTNSPSDRQALDEEVQQRLAEIDRIATQTAFNDQKLLDGTFGNASFQIGANVGQTISVTLGTSMRTMSIGRTADHAGGVAYDSTLALGLQGAGVDGQALAGGDLTITVGDRAAVAIQASVAGSANGQSASSAYAKAQAINSSGVSGLTALADTTVEFNFANVDSADYSLTINGVTIFSNHDGTVTEIAGDAFAQQINSQSGTTGVIATFDSGTIRLSAADGRDIAIEQTLAGAAAATDGLTTVTATNNSVNANIDLTDVNERTATGTIRLVSSEEFEIGGANAAARIGFDGSYALGSSALNTASVTTVANANDTITRIDSALRSVNSLRSQFGAIQNRFESTIANLQSAVENLSAARSRIQDADFAAETAALTRAQILQQAGTAILSQANAAPLPVRGLAPRTGFGQQKAYREGSEP